jgi:hypothetical protein
MGKMKYIIFGDCFPVIFSGALEHAKIAEGVPMPPTSAGYCEWRNGVLCTFDKSVSLSLSPDEYDATLLNDFICEGKKCIV